MKSVKVLSLIGAAMIAGGVADAQLADQPHVAKLNVAGLTVGTFSAQYERALPGRLSFAASINLRPKGGLPLRGFFDNFIDAGDTISTRLLYDSRVAHFAITPELRYYFGRQPMKGFYMAMYARYASSDFSVGYTYTSGSSVYPVSLKARGNSIGVGLLAGAQFNLSRRVVLDWWIAGASVNRTVIEVKGRANLTEVSQEDRDDAEALLEGDDILNGAFDVTVSDHGGSARGKMTLPGLRTGLCIGLRF